MVISVPTPDGVVSEGATHDFTDDFASAFAAASATAFVATLPDRLSDAGKAYSHLISRLNTHKNQIGTIPPPKNPTEGTLIAYHMLIEARRRHNNQINATNLPDELTENDKKAYSNLIDAMDHQYVASKRDAASSSESTLVATDKAPAVNTTDAAPTSVWDNLKKKAKACFGKVKAFAKRTWNFVRGKKPQHTRAAPASNSGAGTTTA